jgi:hypothetical protein
MVHRLSCHGWDIIVLMARQILTAMAALFPTLFALINMFFSAPYSQPYLSQGQKSQSNTDNFIDSVYIMTDSVTDTSRER